MWYEVKVKYSRIDEDDRVKTFNQPYLFDAMSFTEAEARAIEEMKKYISTEFKITNIKVANFAEIRPNENGDRWFKCKLSCITLDEEKGKERRSNSWILVQANDTKDAVDVLSASLSDSISNFEIPSVSESPILDVFPYVEGIEETVIFETVTSESGAEQVEDSDHDELLRQAAELIVKEQNGSASLLQRRLKLGYRRAGRIIDQLEDINIIGEFLGAKDRVVLVKNQEDLENILISINI